MKKYFLELSFICLIVGCSSMRFAKNEPIVFVSPSNDKVLHRLELFENRTFEYKISGDLNEVTSSGNWKIENRNLYLKSFEKYKSGYCKVNAIGAEKAGDDKFNIYVVNNEGDQLTEALVLYASNSYILGKEGFVSVKRGIDTIVQINFLGINYQASLNGINKNDVKIEITLQDLKRLYLNNEVWRVRGNSIFSPLNKELIKGN